MHGPMIEKLLNQNLSRWSLKPKVVVYAVSTQSASYICAYCFLIRPPLTSQHAHPPISFPYSNYNNTHFLYPFPIDFQSSELVHRRRTKRYVYRRQVK